MTISDGSRARVKKLFEPVAVGMGRLGLTPDALTLIGFGITVIGAVLLSQQMWLAGGLVVLAGGAFDMFDGTLARATGKVSKLGAFLDSTFDKAGELIVYIGIIAACAAVDFDFGTVMAAMAMAAGVMVSYTRARSEGLGFEIGSGMAAVGIMPREVRLVILTLGLALTGLMGGILLDDGGLMVLLDGWGLGRRPLTLVLGIIAIGATITTIQRILHVRARARSNR